MGKYTGGNAPKEEGGGVCQQWSGDVLNPVPTYSQKWVNASARLSQLWSRPVVSEDHVLYFPFLPLGNMATQPKSIMLMTMIRPPAVLVAHMRSHVVDPRDKSLHSTFTRC
jgi:hypothetical protein